MYFMDDGEAKTVLDQAEKLVCHGSLKNKSGGVRPFVSVYYIYHIALRFNLSILADMKGCA